MRTLAILTVTTLLVGTLVPEAPGQSTNLRPRIVDYEIYYARSSPVTIPFTLFDPDSLILLEGDRVRIVLEVVIERESGQQPEEGETVDLFYEKISTWDPYLGYFSPVGPPMDGDTALWQFVPASIVPTGIDQYQIVIDTRIPLFNGPNQARLDPAIGLDYDVAWNVRIRVWTQENPTEEDPVPGIAFTLRALENSSLNPQNDALPFADAGPDQTVVVDTNVLLSAERSYDGYNLGFDPMDPEVFEKNMLNFAWEWVSGPQRVDPTYPDPANQPWLAQVTLPVVGTYVYRVFVTDGVNPEPSTDAVTINVVSSLPVNLAPQAVATGPAGPVVVGDTVTLDASASTDPNGDALSYRWVQVDELGGPIGTDEFLDLFQPLSGLEEVTSTWEALQAGTYYFLLIVSDGELYDSAFTSVEVVEPGSAGIVFTEGTEMSGPTEEDTSGDAAQQEAPPAPAGCGAGLLPLALLPGALLLMRAGKRR